MSHPVKISGERGAAMVTAIFALLIGTAICTALYFSSAVSFTIAVNDRDNAEALYLADAGVNHAIALIKRAQKSDYSAILTAGANPAPNTGDELSVPPVTGLWSAAEAIPAGNVTSGGVTNFGAGNSGRYWVRVKNDTATGETPTSDSNGTLIITSTGVGRDGATATIEVTVSTSTQPSFPAFLAAGDVKYNNTFQILGPSATMQIHGELVGSGAACVENKIVMGGSGSKYSLGSVKTGATCSTAGVLGSTVLLNQPKVAPPIWDIPYLRANFRSKANFIFRSDGKIYPQSNGVVGPAYTTEQLNAMGFGPWTLGSKTTWIYNSSIAPPDGIYYFENSNSKFNHGDTSKVPKITLFSEGSIKAESGQRFEPKLPGYHMVSANDIQIVLDLNTNASNPGLVYAYGQLQFANSSTVAGGVIGANFYQSNGTNGPDIDDVGGSNLNKASDGAILMSKMLTLNTHNPAFSGGWSLVRTGWREIRN